MYVYSAGSSEANESCRKLIARKIGFTNTNRSIICINYLHGVLLLLLFGWFVLLLQFP